jgi:hypothetical protein
MNPGLGLGGDAGLWGQAMRPLPEFIARAGRLGFASAMLMGKH